MSNKSKKRNKDYYIERNRAGHLPTLSLVDGSSHRRSESECNARKYATQSWRNKRAMTPDGNRPRPDRVGDSRGCGYKPSTALPLTGGLHGLHQGY
ncbi:hypothetical protein ACFOGG_14105 [Brenneria rubrifaciens]|uniref:Uncharacterized protein n=1 Tax=Brenneria rubrifaciens TaxID=55213 RepID=A0A4P8QPG0_9GAMM|nr:hypothetical protein EH207_10685 [Brenneria rubrifaciens]